MNFQTSFPFIDFLFDLLDAEMAIVGHTALILDRIDVAKALEWSG
jgi:hypothetical protein